MVSVIGYCVICDDFMFYLVIYVFIDESGYHEVIDVVYEVVLCLLVGMVRELVYFEGCFDFVCLLWLVFWFCVYVFCVCCVVVIIVWMFGYIS